MLMCLVVLLSGCPDTDRCDEWSAPVAFRVEAGCGPGGIVVVEADAHWGGVQIGNPAALGLPDPLKCGNRSLCAYYGSPACPYRLDLGDWSVSSGDERCQGPNCAVEPVMSCWAQWQTDGLWFECDRVGDSPCRSRLEVIP
jgi:hypothetical protein